MLWVRVAWIVLSLTAIGLAVDTARWPLLQVTDCELGLSAKTPEECSRPLYEMFALQLVPVLTIPVLLCLIPVFRPQRWVVWSVTAGVFVAAIAGYSGLADSPSIAALGGTWRLIPFTVTVSIAHPLLERTS